MRHAVRRTLSLSGAQLTRFCEYVAPGESRGNSTTVESGTRADSSWILCLRRVRRPRGPHAGRVTTVRNAAGSYARSGTGRDFATNEPGMRLAADITIGLFGKRGRTSGLLSNPRPAWPWLADRWPHAHKPHNRRARDGPRPWTLCRRPVVPHREDHSIRCGWFRRLICGEPRHAIHGRDRRALGQRRCRIGFRDEKQRDVSPRPVDIPESTPPPP